ncbi:hypothetical protein HY988_07215 [Candidatus Micrarchaeota archaeon]|nr:hypothetical protein [Candidatus Micrarchaeota archaeon]
MNNQKVSQETLRLAEYYLAKHSVPDEKFGFGPFLERGKYELFAASDSHINGSIIIRIVSGILWECRAVAEKIHADIATNDPSLEPRIMTIEKNGSVHNNVIIKDPESGGRIRIDASPWSRSLGMEEVGVDTTSDSNPHSFPICKTGGMPFSVKTVEEGIISSYLLGDLPRVRVLERLITQKRDITLPEYRFILYLTHSKDFFSDGLKSADFFLNVADAISLQIALREGATFEELLDFGIIETGLAFAINEDLVEVQVRSIRSLSIAAATAGVEELCLEYISNIPRLMKVLRKAKTRINLENKEGTVNVKSGLITRNGEIGDRDRSGERLLIRRLDEMIATRSGTRIAETPNVRKVRRS